MKNEQNLQEKIANIREGVLYYYFGDCGLHGVYYVERTTMETATSIQAQIS